MFFYTGFDFRPVENTREFLPFLRELKKRLNLGENTKVFSGMRKREKGLGGSQDQAEE